MTRDIGLKLLDRVKIASPCTVPWESMVGSDKVRHCSQCNLNVHNLSAMTADEAETFLSGVGEGRTCGAFFRRADGTVLTQDCPVGLAAVRARVRRVASRIAAAIGLAVIGGVSGSRSALAGNGWLDRIGRVFATEKNVDTGPVTRDGVTYLPAQPAPPYSPPRLRWVSPFDRLCEWLAPGAAQPGQFQTMTMGSIQFTPQQDKQIQALINQILEESSAAPKPESP